MHRFLTVFEEPAADAAPLGGLNMGNTLTLLLLVMLFGCGIYALYTYIRLRRTCMLFPNKFLYPGGCTAETCVDTDGFMDFIEPRLLLLGIVMLLLGIAYFVYSFALQGDYLWGDIVAIFVPAGVLVWYMLVQRKASKLFW